jgi:hypothetical protein
MSERNLPQFKGQYIDITGGVESAAHVREQRDDWATADTDQLTPAEDVDGGAWWKDDAKAEVWEIAQAPEEPE